MTSNYSPWDQGALSFDVNSSLMSIPNLMMDPTFAMAPTPMDPAPISPQAPPSPYRVSSPQEVYQQPPMPSPPPPPTSISSPPAPQMSGAPPPLSSLPSRSSEGPQIRLNPLVMKPNLSHSLPVTTPFKKWVFFWFFLEIRFKNRCWTVFVIARRTTKPIFKTKILNQFTGHLTNLANEWILDDLERQYRIHYPLLSESVFLPFLIPRIFFDPVIFSPRVHFRIVCHCYMSTWRSDCFPRFLSYIPLVLLATPEIENAFLHFAYCCFGCACVVLALSFLLLLVAWAWAYFFLLDFLFSFWYDFVFALLCFVYV